MHDDDVLAASRQILARVRVGVWSIEIEEGRPPRMYGDASMDCLLGVEGRSLTPEEYYHAWYDRVDPKHYDAVADGVDRMVNGCHAEIQYPWVHPTRGVMYVRCGAIRDLSCTDFIRLEGTHQDVSELHHVQKENREDVIARERLNLERRRYVMMCNMIKSSIWSISFNAAGEMATVMWSDEFRRIIGYTNEYDFPNVYESWRRLIHPEDREEADRQIAAALGDKTGKTAYDARYRLLTKDRGWRWFRGRGEVSRDADGRLVEFSGVMTDIDAEQRNEVLLKEISRTSQELERALDEARRAERRESTFLATMSHEIRTPLNAVIGFAEFLRAAKSTPEERDSYVDGILQSSNALLALINDVLDLSKIQAGMMPFRGGTCDVPKLFSEIDTIFRFAVSSKGLKLRHAVSEGLEVIDLREERVRQILINLVGNAVKFTSVGEISYTASCSSDGMLEMRVRDTGKGIPAQSIESIFDPFRQDGSVRGGRVYQGTGLGLSICRRLLESIGGSITVASEPGKGSEFTVRVPNVTVSARQTSESRADEPAAFSLPPGFDVVVVDDVPINLRIVAKHLELLGVPRTAIRLYESAPVALADIRAKRPSLVLTDMWMPVMDGARFARSLRRVPGCERLPVVAETADTDSEGTLDLSAFDDRLTKPLTGEKISRILAKFFPVAS